MTHLKACNCKTCRQKRRARFPNGCRVCFVKPRTVDLYCEHCDTARKNGKNDSDAKRKTAQLRDRLPDGVHFATVATL